jgi:Helix-turn-helix domain
MAEVWESSSAKGGARLVLLALADHANDEGYCHPSVARLARKSALTERNVQLILRNLEARGELVTLRSSGRGNVNAYWVLPPATITRLKLEGKNAKSFHPLQTLEEKVRRLLIFASEFGSKKTTQTPSERSDASTIIMRPSPHSRSTSVSTSASSHQPTRAGKRYAKSDPESHPQVSDRPDSRTTSPLGIDS